MKPKPAIDSVALRHAAEARLKEQSATRPALNEPDLRRLQHEFEVHQIELEMQNEELRAAQLQSAELLERYTELYDFAPVGYFTFTPEGTVHAMNFLGATLLGIARGRLMGRGFWEFVAEADRGVFRNFLVRVLASEVKQSCELRLSHEGTVSRVVQVEGLRSPDGHECRAALLDITERKQAAEVLQRHAALMEQFNRLTVGRELRMIELKKEVDELAKLAGLPPRYALEFLDAQQPPPSPPSAP